MQQAQKVNTRSTEKSPGNKTKGTLGDKKILSGLGGGVALEWYDWNVYGLMAAFMAPHFFPSDDPITSTLAALAVFATGFVARPLGAIILGPIADRTSHRKILIFCITVMAATTFCIAVMPTYEQIGVMAGVILLILRLIQGLVTGAEAPVANTVAMALAPEGNRAKFHGIVSGSFVQLGILASMFMSFVSSAAVGTEVMHEWGWRLPFAIGTVLAVAVIWLRRTLPETNKNSLSQESVPDADLQPKVNVWRELWDRRFAVLTIVMIVGAVQIANYTWNTGLPNMANAVFNEDSTVVFGIVTGLGILLVFGGPVVGWLADRYRASRIFVLTRLLIIPAMGLTLLYQKPGLGMFTFVVLAGGVVVCLNMGLVNFTVTTLMPESIRATGVGIGFSLGVMIFGGTASYLMLWTQQQGYFWLFPLYGALVTALSVVFYLLAKKKGHVHVDE